MAISIYKGRVPQSDLSLTGDYAQPLQDGLRIIADELETLSAASHAALTVATPNGLSLVGQALSLSLATAIAAGAMSSSHYSLLAGATASATNSTLALRDGSGGLTATSLTGSGSGLTNIPQSAVTNLTTALAAKVSTTTTISGGGLITGGGALSSNLTLTLTGASILSDLLTRDGTGSGLDADLLDGQEASAFAAAAHTHAATDIASGTFADARLSSNVPLKNATNTLSGTFYSFSTPSAHQALGVNSAGTAWALRTPGWLDTAQTWAQTQTFTSVSISAPATTASTILTFGQAPIGQSALIARWTNEFGDIGGITSKGNIRASQGVYEGILGGGSLTISTSSTTLLSSALSLNGWFRADHTGSTHGFSFGGGGFLRWGSASTGATSGNDVSFTRGGTGLLALGDADAGNDISLVLRRKSSTTNGRELGQLAGSWIDSTDATRKARVTWSVYDTAAREFLRADATGSAATITITGELTMTTNVVVGGAVQAATGFRCGNVIELHTTANAVRLSSNTPILWGNSTNYAATKDVGLARHAAGTLKITDGSTGLGKLQLDAPTYIDNAAAVAGGLAVNTVYKTSTGELRIVV